MRPKPFTPMPAAAMDIEAPLEVVTFNEVPENEYAEVEPAAARARAAETFILSSMNDY